MSGFLAQPWGLWAVVLPMAAACVAFLAPRLALRSGLVTAVLMPLLDVAAIAPVRTFGSVVHVLGGWPAPLGITLRLDGPAAGVLRTAGLVGLGVSRDAAGWFC